VGNKRFRKNDDISLWEGVDEGGMFLPAEGKDLIYSKTADHELCGILIAARYLDKMLEKNNFFCSLLTGCSRAHTPIPM
jgi:hypothetical protein